MMSMIQIDNLAAIAKACPNVYLDTCCTWSHNRAIETMIDKLGSVDQLMFGSDTPIGQKASAWIRCLWNRRTFRMRIETKSITETLKEYSERSVTDYGKEN